MARREPAEEVARKRLLEDEVRRELALERSSASRMRGIDAVPPPVGISELIEPPVHRYPSIPDAEIGHFDRKNDLPVEILQRIEPAVPRYPSIPDVGIGQFGRQDDPPVPRYPSVPDAGFGPIARQLDPLAPLYTPAIPEMPDPHVPRYPSVPDTAIGPFGGRLDHGQSSELVRGEFGQSLEFGRGPEFGQVLLSGPRPEFGRSLEFGQGGAWMAAAPGFLPLPYGWVGIMERPPLVCPPPPRNANACSLPVAGSKKRTTKWSCALCKVSATSQVDLDIHLRGKKHLEKASARKASQNDDAASVLNPTKATVKPSAKRAKVSVVKKSAKATVERSAKRRRVCKLCGAEFKNRLSLYEHMISKKHNSKSVGESQKNTRSTGSELKRTKTNKSIRA